AATAAGRTRRRRQPRRGGRDGPPAASRPHRPRRDDAPSRAPHGVRDGHLGPCRRARLRQKDRGRTTFRGAAQPGCDRGVSRRGMTALLELEEVHAGYGPTSVLHGVSLSVPAGGVVSLLGANGAGKTTTLRAITGGVRWNGEIRFGGRSLRRMSTEEIVRRGIAHVPEGRGICTELTVDENLKLGSHLRRDGPEVRKDYDRVFEYFPVLKERRRLSASTLSGGEQQMLAVARALLMRPRLML